MYFVVSQTKFCRGTMVAIKLCTESDMCDNESSERNIFACGDDEINRYENTKNWNL